MLIGLLVILILTLVLPFRFHFIEQNLEIFIFIMGLAAAIISGQLSYEFASEIFTNHLMYMITAAVLFTGILFHYVKKRVGSSEHIFLKYIPLNVFVFLLIVVLGLASSIITAIIASLLLVEIIHALPLDRRGKVDLNIISCFSIGLGAALTPIGEPLSTIVTSRLDMGFWYLFGEIGIYVISGILVLGVFGSWYIMNMSKRAALNLAQDAPCSEGMCADGYQAEKNEETYKDIVIRALKVFIFIVALELLGGGFKPIIDEYVVNLDSRVLYCSNMLSAVLDNATLAAAEVSLKMNSQQIQAILMGLLVSGGMLIPGNIPNIISAGKLKISCKEWARLGTPLGLVIMAVYFTVIFVI